MAGPSQPTKADRPRGTTSSSMPPSLPTSAKAAAPRQFHHAIDSGQHDASTGLTGNLRRPCLRSSRQVTRRRRPRHPALDRTRARFIPNLREEEFASRWYLNVGESVGARLE